MTKAEQVRREIELVAFSRISDAVNFSASGITLTEDAQAWVDQLSGGRTGITCLHRSNSDAESNRIRTLIPIQSGRRFQANLDGFRPRSE